MVCAKYTSYTSFNALISNITLFSAKNRPAVDQKDILYSLNPFPFPARALLLAGLTQ